MKLIVTGSTGFVGTEVIRQALLIPAITSIVALGRRPISEPKNTGPNANPTKVKSVILEDFGSEYPESVKKELSGADACIWYYTPLPFVTVCTVFSAWNICAHLTWRLTDRTIAVTPSQLKTTPWKHTVKVSRDFAIRGIETIAQLPRNGTAKNPFRFIYMSGNNAERDQTKKPMILGDYCLLRVWFPRPLHPKLPSY